MKHFCTALLCVCFLAFGCHDDHDHGSHGHGDHQHTVPDTASTDTAIPGDAGEIVEVIRTPLVDMYAFVPVSGENDPWSSKEPAADEICGGEALKAETTPDGDWFDVHTEFCSYSTVSAPLLVEVAEGDSIEVQVYFSNIVEGEGPYALATALGTPPEVFWEESVDVPAEDTVLTGTWTATRDMAVGESAYFHVSNHGENIWSLTRFARVE